MSSLALKTNVVVIGGGAAGMYAAATVAKNGFDTILIEKNDSMGKKLRITGKGRCNVTNSCDVREFMANVPRNSKFLYSAINKLTPQQAMEHFEYLGAPLKVERGNRVFPVSDRAADICGVLERALRRNNVTIMNTEATDVIEKDGEICGVMTTEGVIDCENVIICTGGVSYQSTGSTGDGYKFAKKLGHTIIEPKASLVPLTCAGKDCRDMMGLSLKNVQITIFEDGKKIYTDFGEMLFTHFGLSGPLILSASSHMRHIGTKSYEISIDLKPALDEKMLDKRILSDFDKFKNTDFINSLGDLLPRKMISIIMQRSEIDARAKVNTITKEQRQQLRNLLKDFRLQITGTRPVEEAIITTGGVDVREVSPRTMESKLVRGLYFAGEVLDVDAYTGGFNLQIAWSTANVAANSISWER